MYSIGKCLLLAVLCLFTLIPCNCARDPVVKIRSGIYRGQRAKTFNGIAYNLFRGIKIANVVQEFKEAIPVANSNKTFNATKFGPACYQNFSSIPRADMSVDCLYVNVYSPNLNGNLPVIIFVHGGSYVIGATSMYSGEYFMETRQVVIVTISYRLNAFGFLYLDDPEYPPNIGLRDQILGMQWVQRNIKEFGGDPKRVTASGESVGAYSVNILMHSQLAAGLFIGAISESGAGCAITALQPRCFGLQRRNALAKAAGCDEYIPRAGQPAGRLVECLLSKSPDGILKAIANMPFEYQDAPFIPIVEDPLSENPVITGFPQLAPFNSTVVVPWLTGVNSNEGRTLYPEMSAAEIHTMQTYVEQIQPDYYTYRYMAEDPHTVTDSLVHHYADIFYNDYRSYSIEFRSFGYFNMPMVRCLNATKSPTYSYYFNFTKPGSNEQGVGHTEELFYLWITSANVQQDGDPASKQMSRNFVRAWVDFAYYQQANFSGAFWQSYDASQDNVLIINDNDDVRMGPNPNHNTNQFWKTLNIDTSPRDHRCHL